MPEPSLYGITQENCNRSSSNLWGKNQFNSTFPLALCLKMRDDAVNPVYVKVTKVEQPASELKFQATADAISMQEVLAPQQDEYYICESKFQPYEVYVSEDLTSIDLVVADRNRQHIRPIEIKLTVVPDSTTVNKPSREEWGAELVVRPISSAYAMMSIAHRLLSEENQHVLDEVSKVLRSFCSTMQRNDWENRSVINGRRDDFHDVFLRVIHLVRDLQSPFVIQPIWQTQGQSFMLQNPCFDVFVWSTAAIMAIPLSRSLRENMRRKVSRYLREVVRHIYALNSLCTARNFHYSDTYRGMGLDIQTSKSFSITGKISREYMGHERLSRPCYSSEVLTEIIRHGGEKELRPERRFDAAVVAHFGRQAPRFAVERKALIRGGRPEGGPQAP